MRLALHASCLVADLGRAHRCLSDAVLGGGLGDVRTWLNATVEPSYSRTDPAAHLAEMAAGVGARAPVVGMLTAVDVRRHVRAARPGARVVATVGVRHALAAAGSRPRPVPGPGTINLLVVLDVALADAALVGALQTAVEAKAQALADAGVPAANAPGAATGTATDSVCIACPPGGREPFAGPATRIGGALARAVHAAVLGGAVADLARDAPGTARPA